MNAVDTSHEVVSEQTWIEARKALLVKEKEATRQRDNLSRQRRELPWVKVEKKYVFDGPKGKETLADLFDGRSQLLIYHFMLGPGWEEGCKSCSFLADHIDGSVVHLAHRDVTLAVVSRAPLPEIEAFKKRMGWQFKWVSSYGSDFNFDYHAVVHEGRNGEGRSLLQLRDARVSPRGSAWRQCVLQGRERRRLPHLFDLRAWVRHLAGRLQLS